MNHPVVIRPADHAEWRADKMGKTTLFQSERLLVGLNAFEAGQGCPDALPEIRDGSRVRLPPAGPNGWFHAPRHHTPFPQPGRTELEGVAGSGGD